MSEQPQPKAAFVNRVLHIYFVIIALAVLTASANSPSVSNVRATQRAQTNLVDILYDLTATNSGPFSVSVAVSTNNGATYDLPASSFSESGIGPAVSPGSRKRIVWNAGADWNGQYSDQVRFRVTADDAILPAGMVLIPAGSFVMGNATNVFPASEGFSGERPQHTVYVSGFYMDRYEVTRALWDDVANWAATHGYDISAGNGLAKATNHPVQSLSWYDCVKWCNARSQKDGLTPCYTTNGVIYQTGSDPDLVCDWSANGYRLPTEAEWEKAARGGAANHRFPWSDTDNIDFGRANYYCFKSGGVSFYSYDKANSSGYHPTFNDGVYPYTSPVGYFAANGYGLYDMTGNVWEWCWDWYSSSYYSTSPGSDPRGDSFGSARVLRGGSWNDFAHGARVAYRNNTYPFNEYAYDAGFRCVKGH